MAFFEALFAARLSAEKKLQISHVPVTSLRFPHGTYIYGVFLMVPTYTVPYRIYKNLMLILISNKYIPVPFQ